MSDSMDARVFLLLMAARTPDFDVPTSERGSVPARPLPRSPPRLAPRRPTVEKVGDLNRAQRAGVGQLADPAERYTRSEFARPHRQGASQGQTRYTANSRGSRMRRDEVQAVLEAHRGELQRFGVAGLRLFGSVARDEAAPGSDVDLLVRFETPPSYSLYMKLRIFLEDLLGAKVDLVTEGGLRERVRPYVEREAVRVA